MIPCILILIGQRLRNIRVPKAPSLNGRFFLRIPRCDRGRAGAGTEPPINPFCPRAQF